MSEITEGSIGPLCKDVIILLTYRARYYAVACMRLRVYRDGPEPVYIRDALLCCRLGKIQLWDWAIGVVEHSNLLR